MSSGSWIHDDVSRHFRACGQCRDTDAENKRVAHRMSGAEADREALAEALGAMCHNGRAIYRAYLRWLAEPEE